MSPPYGEPSYDVVPDFGWLYDQVPAYAARADVAFYQDEATRAHGKVIDLGCGSGRMLLPLVRAGHRVTGIDASSAMLTQCRSRLEREPPEIRARATLHQGDIRDLSLPAASDDGQGFALAIAPFRILQHLVTITDQLRALGAIRRQLAASGRFVFDVFNPNFAAMTTDRTAESEDTPEFELPDGRHFRRAARVLRVRWLDQVSDVELAYYLRRGTAVERAVQRFEMRWYQRAELEHLLTRAGFAIEAMYGDFDRSPLGDGSPEIIVVASVPA